MNGEEYEFYIDAYTPSTIPMARLAQYMAELAALFGYAESVHFTKLRKGSLGVVARVAHEAVPKVRVRIQNARDPDAPSEVRRPYKKIDDMLRSDNAVGKLRRGTSNVVVFPGRKAATNPQMGPFTEQSTLDGRIVRIGGTDTTAHALIEDGEGKVLSAECSRELAIELAQYLYRQPVRLVGNARWVRTEVGEWELLTFRAKGFTPLTPNDLATAIGKLREVDADWRREADPTALLRRLRGDSDEVH
ncbi:MAG TPA: hypothetical protein VJQ52_01120 [Steroidobacteraceae bacterium]|nr:hypothetical protein [Steroidobacteraceae bacterium]